MANMPLLPCCAGRSTTCSVYLGPGDSLSDHRSTWIGDSMGCLKVDRKDECWLGLMQNLNTYLVLNMECGFIQMTYFLFHCRI